jgi:hypothetical protein
VLAAVRHAADIQTCRIERIGVNVKTTSGFVGQDEIAFPAIVAMVIVKASRAEYGAKVRYLRVRHRDIEVIVRSRLLSEYGINRPSPINVNLQAILFQKRNEVGGVLLEHNCSVAAVLKGECRISTSDHSCCTVADGDGQTTAALEAAIDWVVTQDLPRSAAHPFYTRLNQIRTNAKPDAGRRHQTNAHAAEGRRLA